MTLMTALAAALLVSSHPAPNEPPLSAGAETPAGQVDSMALDFLMEVFAMHPEFYSTTGLADANAADSPFNKLDAVGPEARARDEAMARAFLAKIEAIDPASLTPDQRMSYDILISQFRADVAALAPDYGDNDRPYAVDQFSVQSLPSLFLSAHTLGEPALAAAYVNRAEQWPDAVAGLQRLFETDADKGILPPRAIMDRVIADLEAIIAPAPADHPVVQRLSRDMPDGVSDSDKDAYQARLIAALEQGVYPAYRALIASLTARLGDARTDHVGIDALPGGKDYYRALARKYTTVDVDPDAVHELGLAEVERIRTAMFAQLDKMGIPPADNIRDRVQALNRQAIYGFTDDDAGRQAMLEYSAKLIEDTKVKTAPYFNHFPKAEVIVVPIPDAAAGSTPSNYSRPAVDGSRPGVFNLNLGRLSTMSAMNYPSLVFHESIPGHHYQIALMQEADLPEWRRFTVYSAYAEGWGLYVETRAEEMGLYDDNPAGILGALGSELFRAARLVVDTGLHAKGWSREQAIQYTADVIGFPLDREVDRYIVMPGQALSYKLGQLKIHELRERAEAALGDRFDVAAFHDAILEDGALPLNVLDAKIDRWIAAQM